MNYVGIDLHKKTISGCVVVKERGKKQLWFNNLSCIVLIEYNSFPQHGLQAF